MSGCAASAMYLVAPDWHEALAETAARGWLQVAPPAGLSRRWSHVSHVRKA